MVLRALRPRVYAMQVSAVMSPQAPAVAAERLASAGARPLQERARAIRDKAAAAGKLVPDAEPELPFDEPPLEGSAGGRPGEAPRPRRAHITTAEADRWSERRDFN